MHTLAFIEVICDSKSVMTPKSARTKLRYLTLTWIMTFLRNIMDARDPVIPIKDTQTGPTESIVIDSGAAVGTEEDHVTNCFSIKMGINDLYAQ
jgi:hypothetical protein